LKIKDFTKIYGVLLLLHLVVVAKGDDSILINFTKPLLVFSLLAYYNSTVLLKHTVDKLFLAGLALSWLGDILLMYVSRDGNFFIFGLAAFLAAHVCYILAFTTGIKNGLVKRKPLLVGIPIIIGFASGVFLMPHLGDMRIPVLIYVSVISIMLLAAINRGFSSGRASFLFLVIGAALFVASDFILAYNKFVGAIPNAGVLIMLTYGLAQYALVRGMLARK